MTYLPGLSQPAPPTTVAWGADMTAYNFGPGHPMAPERMDLTARLARSLGLFDLDHVTVVDVPGDHFTMMSEHAATTTQAITDWLTHL